VLHEEATWTQQLSVLYTPLFLESDLSVMSSATTLHIFSHCVCLESTSETWTTGEFCHVVLYGGCPEW